MKINRDYRDNVGIVILLAVGGGGGIEKIAENKRVKNVWMLA